MQIEPERKGWARLADLVRSHDKERIEDVKEDIDTLLVFVSPFVVPQLFASLNVLQRPVYSPQ